jgi:hypothetical protein
MAVTIKGQDAVRRFLAQAPQVIAEKVLVGAGRAAAKVLADEAKLQTDSHEVADAIKTSAKREGGKIIAQAAVKGRWENSLAIWQEYGTSGHFISVDPAHSGGQTAERINKSDKAATAAGTAGPGESLKIGDAYVGETVHHPGARAKPFMRPTLDLKGAEAVAAAQKYINEQVARIRQAGLAAVQDAGEDDQ